MNRKNLTTAVLAGLAGAAGIASTAQAVNLNPDHIGQVLIYPYYTVNNDNLTLLSVVNTSNDVKAVKVRFLEGQNSQEVLDFNLYLSPYDVWIASVSDPSDAGDGNPTLTTPDNSCTVPYIFEFPGSSVEFVNFNLQDKGQSANEFEDLNPRAREGHFEMITMATITDEDEESAKAATHVEKDKDGDGVIDAWEPADCAQLNRAWTNSTNDDTLDGYWITDPTLDVEPPGDGVLFGGGTVVNVAAGYAATYDARAINGWTEDSIFEDDDVTPLHTFPGNDEPNLDSGNILEGVVFLEDGSTLSSGELDRSVDAVSFVFMHDQLINEYNTNPDINGTTEWVMTFPTKKFYVDPAEVGTDPIPPFTDLWEELDSQEPDFDAEWGACENVELTRFYDQEERTPGQDNDLIPPPVSPAPPPVEVQRQVFPLCFETSVIEFVGAEDLPDVSEPTGVLGSLNATRFHNGDANLLPVSAFGANYTAGWVAIDFTEFIDLDGSLVEREPLGGLLGLPVTGFSVNRYGGEFDRGDGTILNARYGGIFQHKGTRLLSSD